MAKLSAMKSKRHGEAMDLVNLERPLTMTEKEFVLANYKPHAEHNVKDIQAFFTPIELAMAATIEMPNPDEYKNKAKILDICAGIGTLAFAYYHYSGYRCNKDNTEIVCVEVTDEFIKVGKRILPEATWIKADMFCLNAADDVLDNVKIDTDFDCFISNPPFCKIPNYGLGLVGTKGCYLTAQIGMKLSKYGVMIVPKCNCPFEYSGRDNYEEIYNRDYNKFEDGSLLKFAPSCVDTEEVLDDNDEPIQWDGVKVSTEIVIVEDLREEPRHYPTPTISK